MFPAAKPADWRHNGLLRVWLVEQVQKRIAACGSDLHRTTNKQERCNRFPNFVTVLIGLLGELQDLLRKGYQELARAIAPQNTEQAIVLLLLTSIQNAVRDTEYIGRHD